MSEKRVVITGMGAITPLGNTVDGMWQGMKSATCGIGPIRAFDASDMAASLAAECELDANGLLGPVEARRTERYVLFALAAGRQALSQSGLSVEHEDPNRLAVIVGSGVGGLTTIAREQVKGMEKGFDRVWPYFIPQSIANMAGAQLAMETGFTGYCSCVVTACASGSNALGDAYRLIRGGYADAVLAGGTEACVTPLAIGGFSVMKALHTGSDPTQASIPFDGRRSGFVLGEGAGILLLESEEHATCRGAKILAELSGYGATCDAYHITAPEPNGIQAARAISDALAESGLAPEHVGYVNAHGTSTPLNDRVETIALKRALGSWARQVPVSSTKSMTGHLLGAAGAVEAIACVMAITDSFAPPTINYRNPDPECDLDCVPNSGRAVRIDNALSVSLGFGGHNAALIFSKYMS